MVQVTQGDTQSLEDLSIDEIFSRYSVHQVKSLHREYHASVEKAKSDLHSLVGKKYRDLIQIAEDIDKMNVMSNSIDSQLTSLSYKSAAYVSFGNNAYSKFDMKRGEEKSKSAREASRNTIFNNILNGQVLSFDLKLQGSTHINSWNLVHMAKVYYTIKSIFQSNASEAAHTDEHLSSFKRRFNEYLEEKIASRLPYVSSAEGSPSSILVTSESQWLEPNSVDLYDETMEEDGEENSEDEDFDSAGQRKFFGGSTSSMSNYIAAYIILNSGDKKLASLELVARKIVDLRFTFLQNYLTDAMKQNPQDVNNINFSFIIAFAESTNSCISKYFIEAETSDLMMSLQRASSWKAYDFIGFHNWFDNEDVSFDVSKYASLDADFLVSHTNKSTRFAEFILDTFKDIFVSSEDNIASERVKTSLCLFYNFVTACRKAEVVAESNENECLTVQYFSWFGLPQKLLDFVATFVEELSVKDSGSTGHILNAIKSELDDGSPKVETVHELFEEDTIKMIDEDFEKYFDRVLASEVGGSSVSQAALGLKQWLKEQKYLSLSVSNTEASLVSEVLQILNKPFPGAKLFESWGTFKSAAVESVFADLIERRRTFLRTEVDTLLDEIKNLSFAHPPNTDLGTLHYSLNLVDLLKNYWSLYGDSALQLKMDDTLKMIFKLLFDFLQSEASTSAASLLESFAGYMPIDTTEESTTVPLWPHLKISSGTEVIASMLFNSKYLSSGELYDIFSSDSNREIFVNVKNAWILENVIDETILKSIELDISQKGTTSEENTTIPDEQAQHLESDENPLVVDEPGEKEISIRAEVDETTQSDVKSEDEEQLESKPEDEEQLESKAEDEEQLESKIEEDSASEPPASDLVNDSLDPQVSVHKLTKSQSRQLLANVAFLLCLVNTETSASKKLEALAKRISELSESEIEESTLNVIARGVNDFYKSSKHLYLPLSMH